MLVTFTHNGSVEGITPLNHYFFTATREAIVKRNL
jgi:hypothetical protein